MKIVTAIDSFKGSMTSMEAGHETGDKHSLNFPNVFW